jgi:hypothetical protein
VAYILDAAFKVRVGLLRVPCGRKVCGVRSLRLVDLQKKIHTPTIF